MMNEFDGYVADLNTQQFMRLVLSCMERLKLSTGRTVREAIEVISSYADKLAE